MAAPPATATGSGTGTETASDSSDHGVVLGDVPPPVTTATVGDGAPPPADASRPTPINSKATVAPTNSPPSTPSPPAADTPPSWSGETDDFPAAAPWTLTSLDQATSITPDGTLSTTAPTGSTSTSAPTAAVTGAATGTTTDGLVLEISDRRYGNFLNATLVTGRVGQTLKLVNKRQSEGFVIHTNGAPFPHGDVGNPIPPGGSRDVRLESAYSGSGDIYEHTDGSVNSDRLIQLQVNP